MQDQILSKIINYILNSADEKELEIITQALQKRRQMPSRGGINTMAGNMAKQVNEQLSIPRDQIKNMVRTMVVKMIKQQVPDIPDEHMEALLAEWVPDNKPQKSSIPPDVLKTMIRHFVHYSTNNLPARQVEQLKNAMPNWEEEYWNNFPGPIRGLISRFLNNEIDQELFWAAVEQSIGEK